MRKKPISNKKRGTDFENRVVEIMAANGCWARPMYPDHAGNQPFDVLALKRSVSYAFDCKTCCEPVFELSRVEQNQWTALDMFYKKVDESVVGILALYDEKIYFIPYEYLVHVRNHGGKAVNLHEGNRWEFDHN